MFVKQWQQPFGHVHSEHRWRQTVPVRQQKELEELSARRAPSEHERSRAGDVHDWIVHGYEEGDESPSASL